MALAAVGQIKTLTAIKGADRIEAAEVVCGAAGLWSGVVSKGMAVGEKVMVFFQDGILPPDPRWAFMEAHKWRVRMARFKGAPSECVIIPGAPDLPVGADIAELLGVTKHHKPVPPNMAGDAVGLFPTFLPKTDEPNFQTVDFKALMNSGPWYVTEKADGTSCTAWVGEDGLHVCSRNLELREFSASGAGNVYWRTAREYKLENMPVGTAVQFEIIGPGIQSNPHGLTSVEGRLFGAFSRDGQGRWVRLQPKEFPRVMPTARLICGNAALSEAANADYLRNLAEVKYANGKHGEGIVVRCIRQQWSFKVINLAYKG